MGLYHPWKIIQGSTQGHNRYPMVNVLFDIRDQTSWSIVNS